MPRKKEDPPVEQPLDERELKFCACYAFCFDAEKAWKAAGFTGHDRRAWDILHDPRIQDFLGEFKKLNPLEIGKLMAKIVYFPITDIIQWDGADLIIKQTDKWSSAAKLSVKKIKVTPRIVNGEFAGNQCEIELFDRVALLRLITDKIGWLPAPAELETIGPDDFPKEDSYADDPAIALFERITGSRLAAEAAIESAIG